METKPLFIPESKKWKGLKIFCYRCKTNVSEICKTSGKPLWQCKHGAKHVFKVIIHVPGTKNERRTKKLQTRDVNEAIKQAIEFSEEVKSGEYQSPKEKSQKQEVEKEDQHQNKPFHLIQAMARYLAWLKGENVPAHMMKIRSREHVKDIERALKSLAGCLRDGGYNLSSLTMDDIDNNMVGHVFSFLERRKLAPRTFNKYFSYYTSFIKWYSEEYDSPVRNYFKKAKRRNLNPKPEAITLKEYEALLERITPENGLKEYNNGVKPNRNLFRPWLVDSIRLGLETGRRREEIINLKWKDIQENDGYLYIKVEDFKINRSQNRVHDEEKKFIYIPVTDSLRKLLKELDYKKYKGTDNYILAPDIKISRGRVMSDILSRGFTHYYDQLGTERKLTFKSLRKTYITNLEIFMGRGNTKAITGHSADQVIEKNYIDQKQMAKAAQGFSVFSKEEVRDHQLKEIRTTTIGKTEQKDLEV